VKLYSLDNPDTNGTQAQIGSRADWSF